MHYFSYQLLDYSSLFYFSTHLLNLLLNIQSLISRKVFANFETQCCYEDLWFAFFSSSHDWDTTYLLHDVLDTWFQISDSISLFHLRNRDSEHRNSSDIRSHVFQVDTTSNWKSIDHRISIRLFLRSSHRNMTQSWNLSRWKSLHESSMNTHRWGSFWTRSTEVFLDIGIFISEGASGYISRKNFLILESTSMKKR